MVLIFLRSAVGRCLGSNRIFSNRSNPRVDEISRTTYS